MFIHRMHPLIGHCHHANQTAFTLYPDKHPLLVAREPFSILINVKLGGQRIWFQLEYSWR